MPQELRKSGRDSHLTGVGRWIEAKPTVRLRLKANGPTNRSTFLVMSDAFLGFGREPFPASFLMGKRLAS